MAGLGRRLLVLRLAAAGGALAAAVSPGQASTPTKERPDDGSMVNTVQYRSGITDSDPSDQPGHGRGGYQGQHRPRGTGLTDSDPSDQPGYGRGYHRPRGTGLTDSDPSDQPGYGRGGYRQRPHRTGLTDSDPHDSPGHGRRGY